MAAIANALITVPRAAKKRSFFLREPPSSASGSILFWRSLPSSGRRWISGPIRASQPSEKVGGDGGDPAASSASAKILNFGKPLLNFASNNFLPLALVGGVVLGLANPTLGCLADKYALSKFSTFGIFIISGLTLRSEAVGAAAKAWSVGVFGLLSILFFTPYFSRLIMQIQLQPQEFVTGLAIFSCMPTTLSSGVALTHLAGGNSALALAMTVISNLLGILIVPFSISKYIAEGVGVSVPTEQLLRSLVVTLLVPLIFGKAVEKAVEMLEKNDLEDLWAFIGEIFQEEGKLYCFLHIILPILIGLADFVDQNRKIFSHISAILLSLVPWIQVSRSRSLLLMVKPAVFLVAVGMGIFLHLFLLAFNALSISILSGVLGGRNSAFSREENVTAVLLIASQKTLPVMVAVVEKLGGALGESGLLVLPCVAAHLSQIIMDSFLVNFWLRRYNSSSASAKTA